VDVRRGRSLYDSSAGSCYPSNRLKYNALFLCGTLSNEEGQAHDCDYDQAEGLIDEAQQSAMPTDVQQTCPEWEVFVRDYGVESLSLSCESRDSRALSSFLYRTEGILIDHGHKHSWRCPSSIQTASAGINRGAAERRRDILPRMLGPFRHQDI
jgi:hypothetical protein